MTTEPAAPASPAAEPYWPGLTKGTCRRCGAWGPWAPRKLCVECYWHPDGRASRCDALLKHWLTRGQSHEEKAHAAAG